MPYFVGKVVDRFESLIIRTPQVFREKLDIDAKTGHEASEIDLQRRQVLIQPINGGQESWEPFDRLVIATGAVPIRPPVPGIDSKGVFGVNTLEDALRLRRLIDEDRPKRAVIVGGGYIGIEMAEALVTLGLKVSLIDMLPQVMGTLDGDMADLVSEALTGAGVELHLDEKLEGFEQAGSSLRAVKTDKATLQADIAILGMGVRPNTKLAEEAGIPLGTKKSIKVNDRLQTEIEGVWAAGDCAESFHLVSRKPFWIALGSVANKQGRVAGLNIGGGEARFPGVVGTAITKFMETEIARTGLQERELKDLALDYVSEKIRAKTQSHYYPGSGPITVKLFAEKGSGRLLGGQIVGSPGSGKQIDTLATALHAGLTVEDTVNLDLGYAPPYSGAWDPVLIAARQMVKLLG